MVSGSVNEDLTEKLTVTGDVDFTTPGSYPITYTLSSSLLPTGSLTATKFINIVDTQIGTIVLNEGTDTISFPTIWEDAGARVINEFYNEVGLRIIVDNQNGPASNDGKPGEYSVFYKGQDAAGNETAFLERKIIINAEPVNNIDIDIAYHIIRSDQETWTEEDDALLESQMDVLRADFNETSASMFPTDHPYYSAGGKNMKFTFTLKKNTDNEHKYMTFTNPSSVNYNSDWVSGNNILDGDSGGGGDVAENVLSPTNNGTTINVFISDGGAESALGYTYLPLPGDISGIWMRRSTLPYGLSPNFEPYNGYNLGKTLVHEVGHTLGLLHTFDTQADGDLCNDTTKHIEPDFGDYLDSEGHALPNDSIYIPDYLNERNLFWTGKCRNPVFNYMNYSGDKTTRRFTNCQYQRMCNEIYLNFTTLWNTSDSVDTVSNIGAGLTPSQLENRLAKRIERQSEQILYNNETVPLYQSCKHPQARCRCKEPIIRNLSQKIKRKEMMKRIKNTLGKKLEIREKE